VVVVDEMGVDEVGLDEVGVGVVGVDEVGVGVVGADEVGEGEMGVDEVGEGDVGVDEVGEGEVGVEAGAVVATRCLLDACSNGAIVEKTSPGRQEEPTGSTAQGYRPEGNHC
jgi:hypothetical protein